MLLLTSALVARGIRFMLMIARGARFPLIFGMRVFRMLIARAVAGEAVFLFFFVVVHKNM